MTDFESIPTIVGTTASSMYDVILPLDVPVAAIIRKIVAVPEFGAPEQQPDGVRIQYGLFWREGRRFLLEGETLRSAGFAASDTLIIRPLEQKADDRHSGDGGPAQGGGQVGRNVFIGHGRSPLWRELKDFVHGELGLPWDEFNRIPVAGTTTVSRLSYMLDRAAFALLVMTAEDESVDGKLYARQNVIHEVGLFQGRLGFERAIVMVEEGCEQFSNIDGLSQIRFPRDGISARFDDVRQVLEREGMLTNWRPGGARAS